MKTKLKTRIMCILLCICLITLVTLTAFACKKNTALNWDVADPQSVVNLNMEISQGAEQSSVVVTSKEDVFSSIDKEQIKVFVIVSAEGEEEQKSIEITDFSVNFDNARQITITVPNGDKEYLGFNVAIHSSATNSGNFAEASSNVPQAATQEQVQYAAEFTEVYAVGDENPIIKVSFSNTSLSDGFNADMIKLTGVFSNLSITGITGANDIVITTTGTISAGSPLVAGIDFAQEATKSGIAISAKTKINYRTASIKQNSFVLADNKLRFDIVLNSDQFNFAVGNSFTSSDVTYTVEAISEDKSMVTLSVTTAETNLDTAITFLTNKGKVTIPKGKMLSNADLDVELYANKAGLGASINYIEEGSNPDSYAATVHIYPINGEMDTLVNSDITLGGDFEGATITNIEKANGMYKVMFNFNKAGINLEDASFVGTVTLAQGKLKNAWGTTLGERSVDVSHDTGMERGEALDAIKLWIDANESTFKTLGTVGSVVGGVASAANGVVTILGLIGVIETTNDKLNAIRDQVTAVQDNMKLLDNKISALTTALSSDLSSILAKEDKNLYYNAKNSYNSFFATKVTPLQNILNSYKSKYNSYILKYINDVSNSSDYTTIYIDSNNAITLKGTQDGYSCDGKVLKPTKAYRLNQPLVDVENKTIQSKVVANKGRLYTGYWEDMIGASDSATIKVLNLSEGNASQTINRHDYFKALRLEAASYALEQVGEINILNAYASFCYAVDGRPAVGYSKTASSTTPIDDYIQMISTFYNFYPEAREDIKTLHNWLDSFLTETSAIATLALTYADSITDENYVVNARKIAKSELNRNKGAHVKENGEIEKLYSYVIGKTIYAEHLEFKSCTWISVVGNWTKYYFPNSHATTSEVKLIKGRYDILFKAGVTQNKTFADYLVSAGLITEKIVYGQTSAEMQAHINKNNIKKTLSQYKDSVRKTVTVVTSTPKVSKIPLDNSQSAVITHKYPNSKWYNLGNCMTIGTNNKISSEYFSTSDHYGMAHADLCTLDGVSSSNKRIAINTRYYESHWYWSNSETYVCFEALSDMIVIGY